MALFFNRMRSSALVFIYFFSSILYAENQLFFAESINQCAITATTKWKLFSEKGFKYRHEHYVPALSVISLKNKQLFINDKKIQKFPFFLTPHGHMFIMNNRQYTGDLIILKQNNKYIFKAVQWGNHCDSFCEKLKPTLITIKKTNNKHPYSVRVLLADAVKNNDVTWTVSCPAGCIIVDLEGKEQKKFYNMRDISIRSKSGVFFINNQKYDSTKFHIISREGHISFNGADYQGSFIVNADNDYYYLVNSIDIEDYVFSVLRTETWPGWPLEVNKVCAIASRTYVMGVIASGNKQKLPYHVKSTNQHQTYRGVHTDKVLRQAVQETKGIFLAFEGKPILAMFDACCGRVVPAHMKGVNFTHAPYLARNYACTFCSNARSYQWKTDITHEQMHQVLKTVFPRLKKIKEVKIHKKDKAGIAQQIAIKGTGLPQGVGYISGKKWYSLFKDVRSFYYTITKSMRKYIVSGRGVGHHLGLCQWGAREMVNQGYSYKKILEFYYPNTTFMKFG